jgi:hypothetical protein
MNYGYPVRFTEDPDSNKFLQELLYKPNNHRDKQYPDNFCTYTEEVEVIISEHDFYKYGFELTKTDTVAFGKRYEERAKILMRNVVGIYNSLGVPLKNSINKFQDRFGFDEDIWSYQTIKKDFYRNGTIDVVDFDNEIFQKIERIILRNMYNLGTISKSMIKQYENNN